MASLGQLSWLKILTGGLTVPSHDTEEKINLIVVKEVVGESDDKIQDLTTFSKLSLKQSIF